jgi:hypothetical protein
MLKGEVQISLKNAYTNEVEYTSDVIENAFLHNHYFGNHPGWFHESDNTNSTLPSTIPVGNQYPQSVSVGGYAFLLGDEYIPTFDRTVFSLPGTWSKPRDISGTPDVTMSFDNETATVTILRELAPPLSTSTRNINSVALVRDTSIGYFTFISCASFPSTVVQSNTQVAVIQYVISLTAPASTNKSWYDVYHDMLFRFSLILNSTGTLNTWYTGTPWGIRDILGSNVNSSFNSVGNIFNPTKDRGDSWTGTFVSERPNIGSYPQFYNSNSGSSVSSSNHYMGWDGLIVGEYSATTGTGGVGSILGSINVGPSSGTSHWMLWNSVIPPNFSKTQSYQTKINLQTTPFFNVSEIPTTDATLTLNTENYNPRIPEYWKIDFSGSTGGVGVAEYSFMKRYFTGWSNNTFTSRAIDVIGEQQENNEGVSSEKPDGVFNYGPMYKVDNNSSAWGGNGSQVREADELYKNNDIYRVKVTSKEIIFSNFVDSIFKRINSTNYPTFTLSYVSAYEYDELSDSFWLACPLTGLWRVTDPLGSISITNFNIASLPDVSSTTENKAYSLALGTSQTTHRTVWAFIGGALIKSTNNGTSWTAYDSTSTGGVTFTQANIEADWGNVIAVNADKQTDNRLLVLFNKTTSTVAYEGTNLNKVHAVWWSSTSDTTPLLSTDYPLSFMTHSGGGGLTTYLTGSLGWGVTQEESGVSFGTASVNYPASSSLIRKRIKKRFGCTKTQSKWWLSNCWGVKELEGNVDQRDGMTPIEVFFETQIDTGSPGYSKFPLTWSNSTTFAFNSSGSSPYLRDFGLANRVYTNGVLEGDTSGLDQKGFFFYETTDDDGNDCLIWAPYYNSGDAIDGFYKLDFSDHSLTLLQSNSNQSQYYLGRGLFINAESRLQAVGDSFYGWDTAAQLIGEVWERYKWNGSSWVRRQDDNDPLGVKSTHSTTDALIGGATISFDDATGTESYTSGELISVAVCDGIQHDGLTAIDFFAPVVSYYPSDLVSFSTTLGLSTPSELIPFFLSDSVGLNGSAGVFTATTTNPGDFVSLNTDTTVSTKVRLGTGLMDAVTTAKTQRNDIGTPFWTFAMRTQGSNTSSTDTEYFLSTRLKISSAASSDVSLITQPFSDVDNTSWVNHAVVNLQDTWNSPPTVGVERQLAWGLTDSTLYSDAISPEDQNTNVDSFSDITYGFRLRIVENPTENHPNAPAGIQQTSTTGTINDYIDYPFDAGTNNYSENFTSIRYASPILIEVIEGGSVVYSTTESLSQIFIEEENANNSGSYYDGSLATGFRGPIAELAGNYPEYSMFMFPKYSFCPFKIERIGTTVKYYIRGLLVHTSAATSSESLIPCTVKYHNGIGTATNNTAQWEVNNGVYHSFKKAATNDYWVKVGEASPATGAYRTDFSHLQAAYRQTYSITIDGTEANVIGFDNAATLAAGEVSIYPQDGYLRFAAADAGKTIAISMPCAYYDAT